MAVTPFDYGRELQNMRRIAPAFDSEGLFISDNARILTEDARNLLNVDEAVRPLGLSLPTANANRLQERANLLAANGGGYLYLTPGRYYIGRLSNSSIRPPSEEDADLVIPANVTLWFAPAAVLVPLTTAIPGVAGRPRPADAPSIVDPRHARVRIEIQGDIVAGLQAIFDVLVEYARTNDPMMTTLSPAGDILLTSRRIREVYPEWWGAFPDDPGADPIITPKTIRRTTLAVQAAIDAACTRRTTPRRDFDTGALAPGPVWNVRPTIPIVAMGTYVVDAPLRVRSPDDPSMNPGLSLPPLADVGFELRGERGVGHSGVGKANFAAADLSFARFPDDGALLDIAGPTRVLVEGVTFNGSLRATECVRIAPTRRAWTHHSFDGCNFLNCFQTLVVLQVADAGPTTNGPRDFWNVSFTRCRFDPATTDDVNPRIVSTFVGGRVIPDTEFNLVALDVDLKDCGGLVFQSCNFSGHASPCILARSGRFTVNETNFHVNRADHPALQTPTRMRHTAVDFTHGMDIFLESTGDHPPADRFFPATFTAREVESQSWQFLGSSNGGVRAGSVVGRSAVVLLNVHHSPVTNRNARNEFEQVPPALFWGQPGVLGCPLVMVGCTLRGRLADPALPMSLRPLVPSRSVVIVGPNVQGDIFEVACHLLDATSLTAGDAPEDRDFTAPLRPARDPMAPLPPLTPRITLTMLRRLRASTLTARRT